MADEERDEAKRLKKKKKKADKKKKEDDAAAASAAAAAAAAAAASAATASTSADVHDGSDSGLFFLHLYNSKCVSFLTLIKTKSMSQDDDDNDESAISSKESRGKATSTGASAPGAHASQRFDLLAGCGGLLNGFFFAGIGSLRMRLRRPVMQIRRHLMPRPPRR
jgi:hypothetical protein